MYTEVSDRKTFLRTVSTRGMFSGSFLWNNNHSVLLDFFYIIFYLESDRFTTPSVLRILLVCLAIEENCS